MICHNCGIKNNEANKYCVNCGEELIINTDQNVCQYCGMENDETNKFCISCGKKLTAESESKKINNYQKSNYKKQLYSGSKSSKNKNRQTKDPITKYMQFVWVSVGLIIAAIIVTSALDIFQTQSGKTELPFEQKSSNPAVEAIVYEIASKFVCSCGTCNEESLEICSCGRAVEERQFIRNYLE